MNTWPKDLSFIALDEHVLRVVAPGSGNVVGHITAGYVHETGDTIVGRKRWYVVGHEYVSFATPRDAAWALRDYFLGHVLRARVLPDLRVSDGHEKIVQQMKDPRAERLVFKKTARKKRKSLFDDLDSANTKGGVTWH
jgi:hypothetical protein